MVLYDMTAKSKGPYGKPMTRFQTKEERLPVV